MSETLVNLNVNPCKMCMPMGAVTAFYGIQKCMTILHGSQGCSTYIRRHMATHYNEPVDIASSSLTEHGTVYGGEENLMKGLENLIQLYHPEVIGVATTCLAETIGEDIPRIIDRFRNEHPEYRDISILPVATPGYGGTQYEGYFRALHSIVKNIEMDCAKSNKINIVTGILSPADIRYLKEILDSFELDYILLPDLSENLDGVHKEHYDRLPMGGTPISLLKKMAGARYTLELGSFVPGQYSPAACLMKEYGIPFESMNLPIGLRDFDMFLKMLSRLSGKEIPNKWKTERGRYLDAMIDSHKYNAEGRAVIFGEPDFVLSTVRLCVENGIIPVAAATGSVCNEIHDILYREIKELAESYYINEFEIMDDVDFKKIEEAAVRLKANLLIGNSDARRIEEKLSIPLVRRGFPIHDRMGGQRLKMIGYEGSLQFLDQITNAILERKEKLYRSSIYKTYYEEPEGKPMMNDQTEFQKTVEEKTKTHPCYNCGAGEYARMHLPVAPRCNISCNYCVRKFDCPNESRPGVTTKVLTPEEAAEKYREVKAKVNKLTVVGIAGPGDALANFEDTRKTLELIREIDPSVTFCISTNGLMLPMYAHDLKELGVSHVTVTMNAVDPSIGAQIYRYVEYMGVRFTGEHAAAILLSNQLSGIKMMTSFGIMVKVNIVMLKGINDEHIPQVVKTVKELGATITNIMQMIPVKGSVFEHLPQASNKEVMQMRKTCGETMKQMYHCRQCRADAIGTLDHDVSIEFSGCKGSCGEVAATLPFVKKKFAVASKSGMLVDLHFGHVTELYIYEYQGDQAVFKEKRKIPQYCMGEECSGPDDKMASIIKTIEDCDCVVAMRMGNAPKEKLEAKGIQVLLTYDRIEDAVKKAAEQFFHIEKKEVC